MSVKAPTFDWESGETRMERLPDAPVTEFVSYFLSNRAWHDDIEAVHLRVRRLKRAIAEAKAAKVKPVAPVA